MPERKLASYKLRIHDQHVRAMPRFDVDGSPFQGPGVDLRGLDAARVIEAARPMLAWLDEREPGVAVRSISVDDKRVLVSLEPYSAEVNDQRPRALRFEPPFAGELRERAHAAELLLEDACVRALERRRAHRDGAP